MKEAFTGMQPLDVVLQLANGSGWIVCRVLMAVMNTTPWEIYNGFGGSVKSLPKQELDSVG